MDLDIIISTLHGWIFLLTSFTLALGLAMFKGRQTLINLMVGSYLGLFLLAQFPYMDKLTDQAFGESAQAMMTLAVFVIFTFFSTWLFSRLMPREYLEGAFESIGKKLLLSFVAMILIMTLSTHFLPVGEIISTGTPLPEQILSEKFAFVWLVLPLIALFFF